MVSLKHLNLLLADDDSDDCFFFTEALKLFQVPTHLTVVHDGEQLMQLFANETSILHNVLFLDLNMPRKNGFECLSEIKLVEKLKQLVVIIFSTSLDQEVVNRLYKNGAHFYIQKPAEFSQYTEVIHHALTIIGSEDVSRPAREDFVITVEETDD